MRLEKLELTNFKGAKHFVFEPNGENASVYGRNGTGKTTLFDALTWLLYDKASDADVKDFSPKTADADGNEIHNLDNMVRGTFRLEDGSIITLAKTMSEDWTTKRGSAVKTFSGNRTTCAIDEVPCTLAEYTKRVNAICAADKAPILTRPTYFSTALHWSLRRQILLSVCGDIPDEEIIASTPKLADLPTYLSKPGGTGFYSVEEYLKIAAANKKRIDEKLQEIPKRIDEQNRDLQDIEETASADELRRQQSDLRYRRSELQEKRSTVTYSDAATELRRQLDAAKADDDKDRRAFERGKQERIAAGKASIQLIQQQRDADARLARSIELRLNTATELLKSTRAERERLTIEYKSVRDAVPSGDLTVCPCCQQPLPADRAAAVIEEFNVSKSQNLERVRGIIEKTCSKEIIARMEQDIADLKRELSDVNIRVIKADEDIKRRTDEIAPIDLERYDQMPAYLRHFDEIEAMRKQLEEGTADLPAMLEDIDKEIAALDQQIFDLDKRLTNISFYERKLARIRELEEEQVLSGQEYERIERGIFLCEEFIRAKVSLLTERINSHFRTVRFRLFEQQINGGVKECCEVLVSTGNGLKLYKDANAAAQINAGLEIIGTLSKAWGVEMPVFVDNAESVLELISIDPQVIRLVVSSADDTLRIG